MRRFLADGIVNGLRFAGAAVAWDRVNVRQKWTLILAVREVASAMNAIPETDLKIVRTSFE